MNWQPIETAPKDGTIIIGLHKSYDTTKVDLMCWLKNEGTNEFEWYDAFMLDEGGCCDWPIDDEVTHWVPLPELPSGYYEDAIDTPSEITPNQPSS